MTSSARLPAITVLMATHQAERWLPEQLESIAQQEGVRPWVVASDDASNDGSLAILRRGVQGLPITVMDPSPTRFGNANRNFLHLVAHAPIDHPQHDAQFIAFSDHDDVWEPPKLRRAVEVLQTKGAAAYSSNATAVWTDGRRHVLKKAGPQRRWDHLFESPGPGCTIVLTRTAFDQLRAWVRRDHASLAGVKVHDWLFYAHARQQGWPWVIDDVSHMLYRQHERNELGANVGGAAARSRWAEARSGKYRRDVLGIARAIGERSEVIARLERLGFRDRLWLAAHASQCRRHPPFRAVLALMFLMMGRE